MDTNLIAKIEETTTVKYIFCDYYDTVIHRRVHPLQPLWAWAKKIKAKFGMPISTNVLYEIRKQAINRLEKETGLINTELDYKMVHQEIYDLLIRRKILKPSITFKSFFEYSAEADFQSESSVQYSNKKMVATLQYLKDNKYVIYCVSDFYTDEDSITKVIDYHGISHLYDKVIVSSTQNASKENKGILYKKLIDKEGISPEQIFMIGDNKKSDYINAKRHGIAAYHLKRYKQKVLQKLFFAVFLVGRYVF